MDLTLACEALGQVFANWRAGGVSHAAVREGLNGRILYLLPVHPAQPHNNLAGFLMEFSLAEDYESIWAILQDVIAAADEAWIQDTNNLFRLETRPLSVCAR